MSRNQLALKVALSIRGKKATWVLLKDLALTDPLYKLQTAMWNSACYVPKAQLSQLGCATASVIENFAKLLEAMRKYAVEYGMCKFLLVFYNWYDAER